MHDNDIAKLIAEIRDIRERYRKLARDLREATVLAAEVAALSNLHRGARYNKRAST